MRAAANHPKIVACPGCSAPMERRRYARRPQGEVELDLCFACHAIWFDSFESAQLTPGAVLQLFAAIHEHRDQPVRPLADRLRCASCGKALRLTHDVQRSNRITYYRCPEGHGRLSTFFQFLREKSFIRSLTAPEVDRLKAAVAQVRCSSCGAPVDLARDAHCGFCRAPISILDPDAVRRTVAELQDEERRRATVDPAAALEAILAGRQVERRLARAEGRPSWQPASGPFDLVGEALAALMSEFR